MKSSSDSTDALSPLTTTDLDEEIETCRITVTDSNDATTNCKSSIEKRERQSSGAGFHLGQSPKFLRGDDTLAEFLDVINPKRHTQGRSSDSLNLPGKKNRKQSLARNETSEFRIILLEYLFCIYVSFKDIKKTLEKYLASGKM